MATNAVRRVSPSRPTTGLHKPVQKGAVTVERAEARVSAEVSMRGERRGGKDRTEVIRERTFAEGEHPSRVTIGAGHTINMGNFESLRVDVSVSIPCHEHEIEETKERAANYVSTFLDEEESHWLGGKGV